MIKHQSIEQIVFQKMWKIYWNDTKLSCNIFKALCEFKTPTCNLCCRA